MKNVSLTTLLPYTALTVLTGTVAPAPALTIAAAPQSPAADTGHVRVLRTAPVVPVAVTTASVRVTVRPGDTLSAIARRVCGDPGDYWALAYNNALPDPDRIYPGQVLKAACQAAAALIADKYGLMGEQRSASSSASPAPVQVAAGQPGPQHSGGMTVTLDSGNYSALQQCIIERESGGDSQVMNGSSHYGLYQFSASTWAASGGNPADFGHASVPEQNQVFANAVAARGYSDWIPYDHC